MVVPNKIHYIWFGNNIAFEDLCRIITVDASHKKYDVYIWTDSLSVINNTLYKNDYAIDRLDNLHKPKSVIRIRNINDAFNRLAVLMGRDAIVLQSLYLRQMNGYYRNYASASDIARLVILYVEGGVYFDVDVKFVGVRRREFNNPNNRYPRIQTLPDVLDAELGVLLGKVERSQVRGIPSDKFGNAIIAAEQQSELIKKILLYIKDISTGGFRDYLWTDTRKFGMLRLEGTLETTGPKIIREVLLPSGGVFSENIKIETQTPHENLFMPLKASAEWANMPPLRCDKREGGYPVNVYEVRYEQRNYKISSEAPF